MKRILTMLLVVGLCISLSGCDLWMDGSYYSVQPHQDDRQEELQENLTASSYKELQDILIELIENVHQDSVINMPGFQVDELNSYMDRAIRYVTEFHPIAAYAVEEITYDIGTASGKPALAVNITYIRNRTEILRIKQAADMDAVGDMIRETLEDCEAGIVLRTAQFRDTDFALIVQNYAEEYPEYCMEVPQISVVTYPQTGEDRVLELTFTYQTNRDALRNMQAYVKPVFEAAELNVRGEETQNAKFSLMYAFLMERSDYQVETSITPAYSLLRHGVGDSRTFAMVYAAMCRRAGLDCQMVTGTKEGEPWVWNFICEDGVYYYIDLLSEANDGKLLRLTEADMHGYVWDYSSYPAAGNDLGTED